MGIYAKRGGTAVFYTMFGSQVGELLLVSDGENLTGLYIERRPEPDWLWRDDLEVFAQTRQWLDAYFAGEPRDPSELPLAPKGTAFQQLVWEYLLTVPYGNSCTYGEIAKDVARKLGKETMSAQAVGQAVGRNPIWILIPCHRCLGSGGSLTGYAGGLDKKEWLLRHEEVIK